MAEKTESYDGHSDAIYWAYLEKRFRNICTSVNEKYNPVDTFYYRMSLRCRL